MPKLSMKQFGHYTKAVKTYIETGCKNRPDDEVNTLLEICRKCDQYENGVCRVCRCRCNGGKIAFFNKLRMASEHCPQDKW